MIIEIKKCSECGMELKQSGPYAHDKLEGEQSYKGSDEIYFACINEKCKSFGKNIIEMED